MRLRLLLLALVANLLLLVATATGALAHAGLIEAAPSDGSVLPAAPAAITLTFTEPVSPITFSLVGVGRPLQDLSAKSIAGPVVTIGLPAELPNGSYLFSWRVTSEDGHPVNGTIGFAVGASSGAIPAPPADPLLATLIWAVRTLQYLALFFGVGSLAFGELVPLPTTAARLARGLAILGLVLVPLAVGLQGLDLLGLPLPALATAGPWSEGLASTYAQTEALFAVSFGLALLPVPLAPVIAALTGALAPTLSGHASAANPQWLMRAAVFVHIASLMFWLGALLPLLVLLRQNDSAGLRRFSRLIPWVIASLLLSGTLLALVQLGPPGADWFTLYGVLLASKLFLVILLLLLALWNRVRLSARAAAGDTAPLRRSIVVELVLVAVILGIVAGWRFTPPPRVLAEIEAANAPIVVALAAEGASGTMTVVPGRAGVVSITVALSVDARAVTVQLANPGQGVATLSKPAMAGPGRTWRVDGVTLPVGGAWPVAVEARIGDFDLSTLKGMLHLPSPAGDAPMKATPVAAALASSMLLTAPVSAAGLLPACPANQSFTSGAVTVSGGYARATPPGAQSAGAYLIVTNNGDAADTLMTASTPAAAESVLHSTSMNGQIMEMLPMAGGLPVPGHGSAALDPMHAHLMLTGMAAPLVEGQCLEMVLHFAKAGDLPVQLNIGGFAQSGPVTGAAASSMEMSGMDMSSMSSMPGM